MHCSDPRTVGFKADGRHLAWSQRERSKEFATFQLPCGQCLECRLDYGRQWAVRCVHEASMYERNAFITLTYSDENLKSPRLDYRDFQLFMKRLRKLQDEPMGVFVTGEYGDRTKRPHWHAIVFNWQPSDGIYKYSNDRGDKVFASSVLDKTWSHGITEFGSVTFDSAGYCARYAAKKLVHGKDQEHDFHPISKKSNRNAIGKRWLEQNWRDVFSYGELYLRQPDGGIITTPIPRYYEKWLKTHHPEEWLRYVTEVKSGKCAEASERSTQEKRELTELIEARRAARPEGGLLPFPTTRAQAAHEIQRSKFKQLQAFLKL